MTPEHRPIAPFQFKNPDTLKVLMKWLHMPDEH